MYSYPFDSSRISSKSRVFSKSLIPESSESFFTSESFESFIPESQESFIPIGATGHYGGKVSIWNLSTRIKQREMDTIGQWNRIVFSQDGVLLAGIDNRGLWIWEVNTGELVAMQRKEKEEMENVCWGAGKEGKSKRYGNYELITTAGTGVTLYQMVYDVKNMRYHMIPQQMAFPSRGFIRKYLTATFDASNEYVYAGTNVGDVVVFSVTNAIYRTHIPVSNAVHSLVVMGNTLFVGSQDGFIKTFVGQDTHWVQTAEVKLAGSVLCMSALQSAGTLIAYTASGKLYSLEKNLQATQVAEACTDDSLAVAFGNRNDQFATLGSNGQVKIWDIADYKVVGRINDEHPALCFVYDGPNLVIGYEDGSLRSFDTTGILLWYLASAHRDSVTSIAISDKVIVSGGKDGCVRIWNKNRQFITQYAFHKKSVVAVSVDVAKPNLIHSCALDRSICIFDLKTERVSVSHQLNVGQFSCFTQRPNAEFEMITGTSDGRILYWDQDILPYPVASTAIEPPLRIASISLSADGKYLAFGSDDSTVQIWDAQELRHISTLTAHSGSVRSLAWSPDHHQLVSLGADNSLCIWNVFLD